MKEQYRKGVKVILLLLPALFLVVLNARAQPAAEDHLQYVNAFIGTAKSEVPTRWGNAGGTYPGAVAPSGMIQLSPETRLTGARGYNYADTLIYFFSCFGHMSGFPEGSAGQLHIMPVASGQKKMPGVYGRKFKHEEEAASPGYYRVAFTDDGTLVEATATARTGLFRFTFNKGTQPKIFIADAGTVTTVSNTELHAENKYAVLKFSTGFTKKQKLNNGWLFTFAKATTDKRIITIKLSTSTINHAAAKRNIEQEIGEMDFDRVRRLTADHWAEKLSVIDVKDNSRTNTTIFYTALYHSLLIPWVIDDADGRYKGGDNRIHHRRGANQYGAFSPWDTFRTLHPLLTLLYPDKQTDIIRSMLDIYEQTGYLPIESMTGNHAIPIIVDSYLKGLTGFDKALAYKAMKKSLIDGPFLQKDMAGYHKNGYIPFTYAESVTRTTEYAYDDWALSQYAGSIMHDDVTYNLLQKRGYNYRNLFNTVERLFLPRDADSVKMEPGMSGYKEGDKWVYGYFVPHNVEDLINYSGGAESFAERLDSVLTNQVIIFDNETVFHLPYLFNLAGAPQLTQKWCKEIMLGRYHNSPGGLPGNDDLGSVSSWYVLSAMGFYPVCPGRPEYSIGSPLFRSMVLHLPNKKELVINSDQHVTYIASVNINGKPGEQLTIPHMLIEKGGELNFFMSKAATAWPANKSPVELSETKSAAKFEVQTFSLSATYVLPDQVFYARFRLTNRGSKGLKKIVVYNNGTPYTYKNCLLEQGETSYDSVAIKLYETGSHTLSIEGQKPERIRVDKGQLEPEKSYRISGLSSRSMIRAGEIQEIQYTIQNIGGSTHRFNLPVTRNDTLLLTDTLMLQAGATKVLKHRFVTTTPGFIRVAAGDKTTTYKVYQNNTDALLLQLSPQVFTAGKLVDDASGFNNIGHIVSKQTVGNGILRFDEDTHIEVANATSLDEMGETITMMAWVFPTGQEKGLVDIITKGDSHVLQVTDQKTLTFFAGGWGRGDCTVKLPAGWRNHWHHIVGVCSGKKLEVYIDGKLAGTSLLDESADLSNTSKWFLGRNEEFPGERIFHGQLNHVKIYKTPLTAADIAVIYNNEKRLTEQKK